MQSHILQLSENVLGKDYIVGDIHGSIAVFELVVNSLKEVDRLFLVGDLIDRGLDEYGNYGSKKVLDLIIKTNKDRIENNLMPSIYAIRGNHEDTMIAYAAKKLETSEKTNDNYIAEMGGDWIFTLSNAELLYYKNFLNNLPYIIHVTGKYPFNMIHADMPIDDVTMLSRLEKHQPWLSEHEILHGTWARIANNKILVSATIRDANAILTYCGHNILSGIRMQTAHINLDFGAFYTKTLCVANHTDAKCELVSLLPYLLSQENLAGQINFFLGYQRNLNYMKSEEKNALTKLYQQYSHLLDKNQHEVIDILLRNPSETLDHISNAITEIKTGILKKFKKFLVSHKESLDDISYQTLYDFLSEPHENVTNLLSDIEIKTKEMLSKLCEEKKTILASVTYRNAQEVLKSAKFYFEHVINMMNDIKIEVSVKTPLVDYLAQFKSVIRQKLIEKNFPELSIENHVNEIIQPFQFDTETSFEQIDELICILPDKMQELPNYISTEEEFLTSFNAFTDLVQEVAHYKNADQFPDPELKNIINVTPGSLSLRERIDLQEKIYKREFFLTLECNLLRKLNFQVQFNHNLVLYHALRGDCHTEHTLLQAAISLLNSDLSINQKIIKIRQLNDEQLYSILFKLIHRILNIVEDYKKLTKKEFSADKQRCIQALLDLAAKFEIQLQTGNTTDEILIFKMLWDSMHATLQVLKKNYDDNRKTFFKPSYHLCHVLENILSNPELKLASEKLLTLTVANPFTTTLVSNFAPSQL